MNGSDSAAREFSLNHLSLDLSLAIRLLESLYESSLKHKDVVLKMNSAFGKTQE
jgi:hypothetical protein